MSSLATNAITDASGGNTATINSFTPTVSNMAGRNRIINGSMVLDQRNAGASYAQSTTAIYGLDRWKTDIDSGSGRWSVQQVVDAPAGFTNSLKVTITTQEAQPASALHQIYQAIEGYNIADLAFGTASASDITVSFWVKSSVTGTYSLNVFKSDYVYTTSYVVSAANTWEYKTVTIPGATAETWATDNTPGMYLEFTIGGGTSQVRTADTWSSGTGIGVVAGSVYLPATSSATFQVTGVQLEAGSVATPFERRQYGQELALCQRYYNNIKIQADYDTSKSTTTLWRCYLFPEMRATPTVNVFTQFNYYSSSSGTAFTPTLFSNTNAVSVRGSSLTSARGFQSGTFSVDAEL
jgi:hypothetical protein